MKDLKLFVLAKLRKRPMGRHEVIFMFSDKEKNFKRAKDCNSEIQEMAYYLSPDMRSRGFKGHFCYYDCNTKEIVVAPEEELTSEWLENKRRLIIDHVVFDKHYRCNVGLVLLDFVCKNNNYVRDKIGCYRVGKVFIKCGRKARVELETNKEIEEFYQIVEKNLAQYIRK